MTTAYDAWKTHDPREDEDQDDPMEGFNEWLDEADWQEAIGQEGVHYLLVDVYDGRDMALIRADLLNYLRNAYENRATGE